MDEFDESAAAEAFLDFGDFDEGGISRGGERDEEDEVAVAGDPFTAEGHALDGYLDLEADLDWGCGFGVGVGIGVGRRHGAFLGAAYRVGVAAGFRCMRLRWNRAGVQPGACRWFVGRESASGLVLVVVGVLVMIAEDILAEVIFQVTPEGMDMVGVVLGVVVFDDELGGLHPVVVGLAGFGSTGPCEVDGGEGGGVELAEFFCHEVGAIAEDVFLDEGMEERELAGGEFGGGEAEGFEQGDVASGDEEDVAGGFVHDGGFNLLFLREGMHELAAEVFLVPQRAQALSRAGADFSGVRAQQVGGDGDGVTIDDGEIEHEVVAFEAPSPGV